MYISLSSGRICIPHLSDLQENSEWGFITQIFTNTGSVHEKML